MDISVVLATYRRNEIFQRTLESFCRLECEELEWELWVVDNAGDVDTRALVNSYAQKLPANYLVEVKNGKNHALNRALRHVQGDLIVFTDDDILASPDWLIRFRDGAKRWPGQVAFGGRILPDWPDGVSPPNLNNPFLVGAYTIADWDLPEGIYPNRMIFGPNMAIKKCIFEQGWLFDGRVGPTQDTNYVMGSETEFLLRLEKSGFKAVYLPEVLVYHQIRPEQMGIPWLKKRAFRDGLGWARSVPLSTDVKFLFGYPRYLLRRCIENYFHFLQVFFIDRERRNEMRMKLYYDLGQLVYYRQNR